MAIWLALFGWTEYIVDGVTVWVHSTGIVIYNQGVQE